MRAMPRFRAPLALIGDGGNGTTQAKDAFGVTNRGREYDLRHLFIIATQGDGRITRMTSFWDNADWFRQLGKTTLD